MQEKRGIPPLSCRCALFLRTVLVVEGGEFLRVHIVGAALLAFLVRVAAAFLIFRAAEDGHQHQIAGGDILRRQFTADCAADFGIVQRTAVPVTGEDGVSCLGICLGKRAADKAEAYDSEDKKDFYEFTLGLDALKASLNTEKNTKTVIIDSNSLLGQLLIGPNN